MRSRRPAQLSPPPLPAAQVIYVALLTLNWWERCCSRIFIANRFRFEAVRCTAVGGVVQSM